MLETANGVLVRADVAGVRLERTVGGDVALIIGQGDPHVILTKRDVRELAHALSCAHTPYGMPGGNGA